MNGGSFDVTVVGSCMIDLIWYSSRLPRKGETLHGTKFEMGHGGKGANQIVAAAKLGATSALVARLGDDDFGRRYLDSLKNFKIDTRNVSLTQGHSSGMAQITVAEDGDNSIIIVAGANSELSERDIKGASETLLKSKVIVFQMETPLSTTIEALKLIKSRPGSITILNSAPALPNLDASVFKLCDILCANETEAEILTGLSVSSVDQAKTASKKLSEMGCSKVIVTLGGQGVVFQDEGEPMHIEVKRLKPIDTTGAGDCFVGALAFYLSRFPHLTMSEQIRRASVIASQSVLKKGTHTSFPSREELDGALLE